ncbi:MAG: DUF4469 domain-containing protein [Tannerellaceae bacterium]|jgi:hypothetical protein|nr:DUF4469 domain-containing protein [Tannerellaceae bacterium]
MAKKFLWKLWLRLNLMTKDVDDDYFAEVSTAGRTLRNEDIARRIVDEGSEIKYNTLFSIINQVDLIKREALLSGASVLDGVVQYTPHVAGNWPGGLRHFDPARHRFTLTLSPAAEMRKALAEEVEAEVLGIHGSGARIGLVTDLYNGLSEGHITRGASFAIEGNKIKIVPDENDPTLGIFLHPATTTDPPADPIRIPTRLIQNTASKIIAQLPADIPKGRYHLRIVTRYGGTSTLVNAPRTLAYHKPLTVTDATD